VFVKNRVSHEHVHMIRRNIFNIRIYSESDIQQKMYNIILYIIFKIYHPNRKHSI